MPRTWHILPSDAPGATSALMGVALLALITGVFSTWTSLHDERTQGAGYLVRQRALPLLSLSALAALLVMIVVFVGAARAELGDAVDESGLLRDPIRFTRATALELGALFLGSCAAGIAGPPVIIANVAGPLGHACGSQRATRWIVGAGLSATWTATASACAVYAHAMMTGVDTLPNADARSVVLSALVDEGQRTLRLGGWAVAVFAVLTVLAVSAVARRRASSRERVGARGWIAALLLIILGGVAFAWTRHLAYDAEHPVSFHGIRTAPLEGLDPPVLEQCDDYSYAPSAVLVLRRGEARLDDQAVTSPDALLERARRTPSYFGQGGALYIAADGDRAIRELSPWLDAAHSAGQDDIHVIAEQVGRVVTRTRGTIVQRAVCGADFILDPDGEPLVRYGTWRDLARSAARTDGELRIAP